jgi:hypothetical protein
MWKETPSESKIIDIKRFDIGGTPDSRGLHETEPNKSELWWSYLARFWELFYPLANVYIKFKGGVYVALCGVDLKILSLMKLLQIKTRKEICVDHLLFCYRMLSRTSHFLYIVSKAVFLEF